MRLTIDMPLVAGCTIYACAYNVDDACHARAITIGAGSTRDATPSSATSAIPATPATAPVSVPAR